MCQNHLLSLLQTNKQIWVDSKIAQTWLLPNNQSDAQEFDECTTSANQKMSYLMDVSYQPIKRAGYF